MEDDDLDSLVEPWQPKQTSDVMRRAFAERAPWTRRWANSSPATGSIVRSCRWDAWWKNRSFGGSGNRIGNPLFSAIVATRRDPDTPLSDLVERFLAINRRLNRLEMVHCLCILGEACYLWGWVLQGSSEANVATFFGPQDLQQPLMLIEGTPDRAAATAGQGGPARPLWLPPGPRQRVPQGL
ncbi:hypothetical protein [Streptomyces sp. NPDC017988]|uniref:hypothetical protein n=1 Tax=Streptomyces sp. NPDC017988 TaxID=3365025 RepID=UPI00379DAD25